MLTCNFILFTDVKLYSVLKLNYKWNCCIFLFLQYLFAMSDFEKSLYEYFKNYINVVGHIVYRYVRSNSQNIDS